MRSHILSADPLTGIKRIFHPDADGEGFTIETKQDVTDLVELNKASMAAHEGGWKGDMHRVASIPLNIFMDLKEKGIIDDEKAFRRWLDDPDNRHFRTRSGRLSR